MKITFVGHATVIVETGSCKFITDPLLVKRPGRVGPSRKVDLVLDKGALEGLDFATVSHGHFDHLDKRSLCMLPSIPVLCHPRLQGIVRRSCKREPVPLSWWEGADVAKGVRVTAVPAKHFAARPPFQWSLDYQGYVIECGDVTVYHAGDCGMSEYFKEIADRFRVDVALLPIGAYDPPSFRKHHLAPEDALDVLEILGARLLVPMHWGTFDLSYEPFDEPPLRLMEHASKRGLEDKVRVLKPGERAVVEVPG